jgi:alpha,alpha-trehalase
MDDLPGEISPRRFDAVLFDLDGVLTDTARIHARAWQETFDAFLRRRGPADDPLLRPFDREEDYRLYVDGKPRPDGVRDFLASRRITLPEMVGSEQRTVNLKVGAFHGGCIGNDVIQRGRR